MSIEEQISDYIKQKGVSLTAVSKKTGVPYSALQPSLKGRRELRAQEFMSICKFFDISPAEFANKDGKGA